MAFKKIYTSPGGNCVYRDSEMNEYRVAPKGVPPRGSDGDGKNIYFTDDKDDAIATAKSMDKPPVKASTSISGRRRKVHTSDLDEGSKVVIDGKIRTVDFVRGNPNGTWVYFNNGTASRFFDDGETVEQVLAAVKPVAKNRLSESAKLRLKIHSEK